MARFLVAAFYKFTPLTADAELQAQLQAVCTQNNVWGTVLLAHEGINGTIAGPESGMRAVLDALRALPGCSDLEHKESWADEQPFLRMKVRLKKEIVTIGIPEVDPTATVGHYVDPEHWNELISAPDVVTIDTRNDYEVRIGKFKGAKDPNIRTFRDFPSWFREFRRSNPDTRVAMYCTGGIRCEKSTSLARAEGLEEVYHLKGGILKYLETVPEEQSLWQGECFVFDGRVAVGHGLTPGHHETCRACRDPLTPEDLQSELYEPGVSCPHCYSRTTPEQRARFAERHRQVQLAESRGERHVGSVLSPAKT